MTGLFLLFGVFLGLEGHVVQALAPVGSIQMTIDNFSGKPIRLFWISFDNDLVAQTKQPILNGSNTVINSYNTHRFKILADGEVETSDQGASFVKGPYEETINVFSDENDKLRIVQVSKYDEFHDKVVVAQKRCGIPSQKGYSRCVSRLLYKDMEREEKIQKLIRHYRDENSNALRNYTCADPLLESTEPLSHRMVEVAGKSYNVSTLLDLESARIWTVEDFISDSECDTLITHGSKNLKRATVAGEDGLFTVSESRKAQQASYQFTKNEKNDPLWGLYSRIFEFTNTHTSYNMKYEGQEGFTIIQYNEGDEYRPHCDGSCDGTEFLNRGRVATAVVYCMVPKRGGGTSFTKSNIFVKPKKGMATFFAYKGPDNRMDSASLTEHSGCPILEGEKWIATVWMRQGVSKDHDWQNVDPSGERIVSVRLPEEEASRKYHTEL